LDLALDVLDLLELVAQLDNGEVDHSGIETEGTANGGLDGTRGIESHDEMVAFAVTGLVLGGDLGQAEDAPVGVAADDTAGADDLSTSVTGNSVKGVC
jgi:hypothetical protein